MRRRDFCRVFCWLCLFVVFAAATASHSPHAQQNQADGVPRSELCGTTPEEFWSRYGGIPDERKWECYCFANPDAACHGSVSQKLPAKAESGSASQKPPVKTESVRKIGAEAIFATNLILNGAAEEGPGSPSGESVELVPGWITTGNFTVAQYGDAKPEGADVKLNDPGPVDRGKNFFAGGPDNASSSAAQVIDVSAAAAAIDRGEVFFNLAAYLGGWRQQNDGAALSAMFRDMNGNLLGQIVLGPVTAVDRNGKSGLLPRSQAGMVPKGTRVIEFELRMTRDFPTYNDGYADNLSFRLARMSLRSLISGAKAV